MPLKNEYKPIILSKLTFRQYLALSLISSKYFFTKTYPSAKEIKETIGFETERMLYITLQALVKKGFLNYNGLDSNYEIRPEAMKVIKSLIDPLMTIHNYTSYEDIKNKIKIKENINVNPQHQLTLSLWGENQESMIKKISNENRIHRWYTFLEDFPPSLIFNKLSEYAIKEGQIVLDPFSGSGTTLITSNLLGIDTVGIDVNPVASFVSRVKTTWNIDILKFEEEGSRLVSRLKAAIPLLEEIRLKTEFTEFMDYIELHQWLKPKQQNEVAFIKEEIDEISDSPVKDLLKLALIESAVESSNVSFCPGTSFYPFRSRPDFYDAFLHKVKIIIEDLVLLKKIRKTFGKTKVYNEDCRLSSNFIKEDSIDFIITSPPYPNDLEYTRQTRLELFLLGYIKNLQDVQDIKRKMVKGSTKLIYKDSDSEKYVKNFESVQEVSDKIASALSNKKWGWDYPRMIREYFGDMYLSLLEFKKVLKPDAHALLVVGDQTYKQVLIPVGKILQQLAEDIGYSFSQIELFRVRGSTIHEIPLNEEILILRN